LLTSTYTLDAGENDKLK